MKIKTPKIEPRQKISVLKESLDGIYNSTIEYTDKKTMYITMPLCQQVPMILHRGDKITVRMYLAEHVLEFKSSVNTFKNDNIILLGISYPEEVERIQLRKYVRIDILLDIMYTAEPGPDQKTVTKKASALNISAGGMKLAVKEKIAKGQEVTVRFTLPVKNQQINYKFACIVRRSFKVTDTAEKNLYHLGLEFKDITRSERDQIMQYIFSKSNKKTGK